MRVPPPPRLRDSLRPLKRILEVWPILAALAGGLSAGAASTYAWVSSRIHVSIEAHDRERDHEAHPAMQTRLKALEDYAQARTEETTRMWQRLSAAEKDLYELYWFAVGARAADTEDDPRKRALACRRAQEHFRKLVQDGEGLKDAYRHALELPPPR